MDVYRVAFQTRRDIIVSMTHKVKLKVDIASS